MERKYKINLNETISQIKKIYFTVGLWRTKSRIVVISQFFLFFLISSFTISVIVEANITEKAGESVFLTVTALIGTLQAYRLYYVITKQTKLLEMLNTLSVNSTDDYDTFCSAESKLKNLITFARTWINVSFFLFVSVVILPLIKKGLIFDIALPFNYKTNLIGFWIAYLYVATAFLLSVSLILFAAILIWYMMLNFVIKYDILGNNFKNLGKILASETNTLDGLLAKQTLYLQQLLVAIKSLENTNECAQSQLATETNL